MTIGSRIKELRNKQSISQAKLAKLIGVSAGNVGEWELERSKPGAEALLALSKYFKVSTDWILNEKAIDTLIIEQEFRERCLSQDEIELITKFRHLNERQKGIIEGYVMALLENTFPTYSNHEIQEAAAAIDGA